MPPVTASHMGEHERAAKMAVNFPIDYAPRNFGMSDSTEKPSGSRNYNSFIVRLWQDDDTDAMLRVELQHVQAGLSIEALKVPLDWIVPEIMGCIQLPESEQGKDIRDSEEDR